MYSSPTLYTSNCEHIAGVRGTYSNIIRPGRTYVTCVLHTKPFFPSSISSKPSARADSSPWRDTISVVTTLVYTWYTVCVTRKVTHTLGRMPKLISSKAGRAQNAERCVCRKIARKTTHPLRLNPITKPIFSTTRGGTNKKNGGIGMTSSRSFHL